MSGISSWPPPARKEDHPECEMKGVENRYQLCRYPLCECGYGPGRRTTMINYAERASALALARSKKRTREEEDAAKRIAEQQRLDEERRHKRELESILDSTLQEFHGINTICYTRLDDGVRTLSSQKSATDFDLNEHVIILRASVGWYEYDNPNVEYRDIIRKQAINWSALRSPTWKGFGGERHSLTKEQFIEGVAEIMCNFI